MKVTLDLTQKQVKKNARLESGVFSTLASNLT